MSDQNIRKAFEKRLALMTPSLATAYENAKFVPVTGTPYQRVYLLPGQPENPTMGDAYYREAGVFQITLCYPIETGPAAAEARAEAIKQHFKRGTSMTEGGQTVLVIRTPAKAAGYPDGDRYLVPISIYYRSEIF